MKNLVLIGGGYGNMRVLHRLLPNQLPDDVTITLIDRNPYHCLKQNIMHLLLERSLIITFEYLSRASEAGYSIREVEKLILKTNRSYLATVNRFHMMIR